jgi:phytoene dehydrogenase-like protein
MPQRPHNPDAPALIVGSGPNGLAAAVALAQRGVRVRVVEMRDTVGGGCRSAPLTLPGFTHDICSAVHPLGLGSPFLSRLPLDKHGLEWVHPRVPLAHPLDDGRAVLLHRSIRRTAEGLGRDGGRWAALIGQPARDWLKIRDALLSPLPLTRHLIALARFGLPALLPAGTLARAAFGEERARALFAGIAAHSMLPLERPGSAAAGMMLGAVGHAVGWPVARGGSQRIVDALTEYLRTLGGEVQTGVEVRHLEEWEPYSAALLDVTPRQLTRIAGDALPEGYRRALGRYRYGQGVFKVDYALDGPVPWRAPECGGAGTVHLGGTLEEIEASERAVWEGRHHDRPFVLVAQPGAADPTRAPEGKHTLWAYCHVPRNSTVDMTAAIDGQIERFAPGFRERIHARHTLNTQEIEAYNPNYIGGDINGGVQDLLQLFTRPLPRWTPYGTPNPRIFLCSSSTPPGGGVHGMCGYHAAQAALNRTLKK